MDDRDVRLSEALAAISSALREAMTCTLVEAGVTHREWMLLAYLYRRIHPNDHDMPHGVDSLSAIPHVEEVLTGLHSRGYVRFLRKAGIESAVLTQEGGRLVRALVALNSRVLARATADMRVDEADLLVDLLERAAFSVNGDNAMV